VRLLAGLLLAGCSSSGLSTGDGGSCAPDLAAAIGQPCVNPIGKPPAAELSSPALECPQRLCLLEPVDGGARATCTAKCSADCDCAQAQMSECAAGFVCAPVTAVGDFACQKLCVCASDVQPIPACH
jgi:hypothetical protein